MTDYKPGDIALVQFPFTDLTSAKRRPALVLSEPEYSSWYGDIVLLALTSQPQGNSKSALINWRAAGLPKPTWTKPLIGTISETLVTRIIRKVDPADEPAVRYALKQVISDRWLHANAVD